MTSRDSDFYDATYFGHAEGPKKSNYPAVGGYHAGLAAPEKFVAWVQRNAPDAIKVLELGCATGAAAHIALGKGLFWYGVDISTYIISQAIPSVKDRLFVGDLTQLDTHTALQELIPFDVVVSKDVLEHFTEAEIPEILIKLAKLADLQLHVVNTGQYDYQAWEGDSSHLTRQPLDWWARQAGQQGIVAVFKET